MLNFTENDLILVTGASSGIGQATVLKLNALGARTIAIGRNQDKLRRLYNATQNKDLLYTEVFDFVENLEETENLIKGLVDKYGKLSGFVHSAGALRVNPIRSENLVEQRKLFDLNVFAALIIMKVLANKRYKAKTLSCVLLSSIAGINGDSALTTYSASKGAIISSVKALAKELGHLNVRVNAVAPGTVKTDISQANPAFFNDSYYENISQKWVLPYSSNPEQVAALIVFLLSEASNWITGQNIVIDGGESL